MQGSCARLASLNLGFGKTLLMCYPVVCHEGLWHGLLTAPATNPRHSPLSTWLGWVVARRRARARARAKAVTRATARAVTRASYRVRVRANLIGSYRGLSVGIRWIF